MGDLFTMNTLSKIMAGKEGADMLFGVIRYFFGNGDKPTTGPTIGLDDGIQKAKSDGKGNIDEHNYLIGLAEVHFGASLSTIPKEELTVSRGRFRKLMAVHKLLREQGKSGGAEKLMHIIGHESHLQGTAVSQRASGPKGQKPEGEPPAPKIDIHNVRERTNPAGRLIIHFLTDITPQEAVELLTSSAITDTARDSAAATTKAAADKGKEVWEGIKKWWYDGNRDTWIHSNAAAFMLNDKAEMDRILTSDGALERWNSYQLEANDPVRARAELEKLQRYIWKEVNDRLDKRRGPSVSDPDQAVAASPSRLKRLRIKVPLSVVVWVIPVILLILIVFTQQLRSPGT